MRTASILLATFTALATSVTAHALPGDARRGEQLHQTHCTTCHDHSVYTRKDRQIGSLQALQEQINACGHNLPRRFSADEVRDLVKYLNDRFYRFE